ncbi:MAG: glycosyltransferase family 4 protein [Symploca sp. SIO2E6]|nr:glycosyltransferase family 4 protein [Symploca sp. SIO2E6]
MKILLDCRFKKGAGPNVATLYMLDELIRLNTKHEFIVLHNPNQSLPEYPGVEKLVVPVKSNFLEFLWVQFYLPKLFEKLKIDIYHSLKHVSPLFTKIPTIEYIHEVGHFFSEGLEAFNLSLANRIYHYHLKGWSMRRATHIIGTSQQCEKVLHQKLGISKEKISTIRYGLDKKFRVIDDRGKIVECCQRYGLPESYILCVGNICAQENYDSVIKMYSKLRSQNENAPKLVLVGDTGNAESDFLELMKQLGLNEDVILTGFVEHRDLVYIYNGANLLLFPPTVAAFGIPPIEAMACGIPVVASNIDAIPEISGEGAALLFDEPRNVDKMLEAVNLVLHDHQLRQELRNKGFERAKEFSWEASALRVLDLYEIIGREKICNLHSAGSYSI